MPRPARRPLLGVLFTLAVITPAGVGAGPADAAPAAEVEVTDLTRTTFDRGPEQEEVAMTSYAARYEIGEDIVSTVDGAALPTVTIPPGDPALEGLPNPATGDFVMFAAPAEGGQWEPVATQVGGLYLSPRLTPHAGAPAHVDLARAGDVVDFGVAHFAPEALYEPQDPRPATGRPTWELTEPVQLTLDAATARSAGGVVLTMRQAFLRIEGGDLEATGLTADPLRIPLPDGAFTADDTNVLWTTMSSGGTTVDVDDSYDADTRSILLTPTLTGRFPESTIPEEGPRSHVIGITAFAFARRSGDDAALDLGASLRAAAPAGAQGSIDLSSAGDRVLHVPLEAGRTSSLSLGAAVPAGLSASRAADPEDTPPAPPQRQVLAGSLDAVLGAHETSTGQVAFEIQEDVRGAPAIVTPRVAATGEQLADAVQIPYVRRGETVDPLTTADVVDARYIPAAWGMRGTFTSGWIPGMTSAYYGEKPMPYFATEDVYYATGATIDLVFRLEGGGYLHAETSISEVEAGGPFRGRLDVETMVFGPYEAGPPDAGVLVASHGSAAELNGRAPLSHEAALPGGVDVRYSVAGPIAQQNLVTSRLDVIIPGGRRTVEPVDAHPEKLRLYVLAPGTSLPAPASPGVPPAALTPADGLDVVTEGSGARLRLR